LKKIFRRIFLLLIAAFAIIQFFHTEKNIAESQEAFANDITNAYPVPEHVKNVLQTSCYDCHSNNTIYPWYDNIQPVSWWLNHHIEEGKRELNFNEFASYRIRRQYKKLEEIIEQVKEGEMPLSTYTLMHKDAALNKEQKLALSSWAAGLMDSIRAKYPPDSLLKDKPAK
jgi:Haem-binding domain